MRYGAFFAVILILAAGGLLAQTAIAPAGDGSSGNPYQIATWQNLYWISQNSSSWDKHFIQTANIDLTTASPAINTWDSNQGWKPIGDGNPAVFTGSYDGQNHIIKGIYINRNQYRVGFFGYVQNAVIQNLGLVNVNITNSSSHTSSKTGALIGIAESTGSGSTSITNCFASGSVTGSYNVGGLIGETYGYTNSCTISKSYSTVNVKGKDNTGGFVGYHHIGSGTATISDCYSLGNVTRSSGATGTNFGAFIGCADRATTQNCYTIGSVYYEGATNPTNKGFLTIPQFRTATNTNNFWDNDVSNQSDATGATSKTTAQMKTQATFTGWDFTNTWEIVCGDGSNYPTLRSSIFTYWPHIGTSPRAYHCVVSKSDGTVYTWGWNDNGQLGNGNNTASNVPVAVNTSGVLSGKTIKQVAAGHAHCIALANDGTVYTWGWNQYGQLGNGSNTDSNVPVAVDMSGALSGKKIIQVAAGYAYNIALASDGTVYTWGWNERGQLGNGNNNNSNVPVAVYTSGVLSGKKIIQVSAGSEHSIVLANDGTVYTWGYGKYGQLGNGISYDGYSSNVPVAVNMSGVLSGKTITQVAAGALHSIAIANDGKVYTWGFNHAGQLGNGNTGTNQNVPVAVDMSGVLSGKTITQVAGGHEHCIALANDSTVYTWGFNNDGQLGNGNNTWSNVPVAVYMSGALSGKKIIQVATGYEHCIVLASDGTVYTWGQNGYGQLGNRNTGTNQNVPVAVDISGMGNLDQSLPVELTSFSAVTRSGAVVLTWRTESETENLGFCIVKRLLETGDWQQVADYTTCAALAGHGSTSEAHEYTYTDAVVVPGATYFYRLGDVDYSGKVTWHKEVAVKVETDEEPIPLVFGLQKVYPNPFNPSLTIPYGLTEDGEMSLKVYNLYGQLVETLANGYAHKGAYSINWQPQNLSSGVYFIHLQAGNRMHLQKVVLIK